MVGEPFIPEQITVHLGRPDDSSARNVTMDFPLYIKNVASSELYPTWPEAALRANIYAIISFALNRYYTEWYRSRGYDFDITNTTQYDQAFVENRSIYEPISEIVDEIFNSYIVRDGSIVPMATRFCDGKQSQCEGLTQWGSVEYANQGLGPYDILTQFYGPDINIVKDAPVHAPDNVASYPGEPLSLGSSGPPVERMARSLNTIGLNYPAIPKITPVSNVYDLSLQSAVKKFQEVFNLPVTGVIDSATWYKIIYIYTSVKKLAELDSLGASLAEQSVERLPEMKLGDKGVWIRRLDYLLAVVSSYYRDVQTLPANNDEFGPDTEASVKSFQKLFGLPETGVVDTRTWQELLAAYRGIADNVPLEYLGENVPLFPGDYLTQGITSEYVKLIQEYLSFLSDTYPEIPKVENPTGYYGPQTDAAVKAFQKRFGLPVTGDIGLATWDAITELYTELKYGYTKRPGQYPGYIIS
ncbi:MAG: peptidoglycan-binding protein [Ruminococcus sp.]|jgi:peptidoglycan hydrolase-like protein with peptidoglycan-binding domain|nr:peptidoglycan-binding protein [Ruminococcus sp.]